MRPLFLGTGVTIPERTLIVDCDKIGQACYSHWRGAVPTPPDIIADTSCEIVLNAARDPQRWLQPFAVVANDHVDADGLLAVAAACRPHDAHKHRTLLIDAAVAGDFSTWTSDSGVRLMLTIHQWMRDAQQTGNSWEQVVMERVVNDFTTLIQTAELPNTERDLQINRIKKTMAGLRAKQYETWEHDRLYTIAYNLQHGHHDGFCMVEQPDDLPVWALGPFTTPYQFQLLAGKNAAGTVYQLDAPRHSWAHTVHLPTIAWPNFTALAHDLQQREKNMGTWICLPRSRTFGFVCMLTFVHDNKITASSLPLDDVRNAVTRALENAKPFVH
jgi:hypothetical protein